MSRYNPNQVQSAYSNQNYMQNQFGGVSNQNQAAIPQPAAAKQAMTVQEPPPRKLKSYKRKVFKCCGVDIRCGVCFITCCEIFGLILALIWSIILIESVSMTVEMNQFYKLLQSSATYEQKLAARQKLNDTYGNELSELQMSLHNSTKNLTSLFCKENTNFNNRPNDLYVNESQYYEDWYESAYNEKAVRKNKYKTYFTGKPGSEFLSNYTQMKSACENQKYPNQCKSQVILYQDWNENVNDIKKLVEAEESSDNCPHNVINYIMLNIYAFGVCFLPRLYFIIKGLYWICKGSATDEAEDRYSLVLAFTGLAISNFCFGISPFFVGFIFSFSGSVWMTPLIYIVVHFFIILYWRFVMILYYEHKDIEYAEELELEEKNLNAKPTLSNVSFTSTNALMSPKRQQVSRY